MRLANDSQSDLLPKVIDDDIQEVERRWRVTFDDPRRNILRSNESFDVEACPGSGKTTLLVAKLAILAKKWPHSRRGICVLSHTNVAREEVATRLADMVAGQRLFAFPHFVGTIHGFVNEFLALPLLRSEGRAVRIIDDEACGEFCRRLLYTHGAYARARQFLTRREQYSPDKTIRALRYEGAALTLGAASGSIPCGAASESFRQLSEIKRRASEAGIWRYDDMFACAARLLERYVRVVEFARWRFPAVFIDEMQDTSEVQNEVLARVFPVEACSLRQRFGDPNQAIYDFGQSRATTDPFPSGNVRTVPNSKRFGPKVAKLAAALAPVAPNPALIGEGPQPGRVGADVDPATMPHTIFCFSGTSTDQILPAFAKLLVTTFPDAVLLSNAFVARVIGRIGNSNAADDKSPCDVRDYWAGYEPKAAKPEPRPARLADYLHLAQRERSCTGDCATSVQTAAKGLLELVGRVLPLDSTIKVRSMKWLRELVGLEESALREVQHILWRFCVDLLPILEQGWSDQVEVLRVALAPVLGDKWTPDAEEFCTWSAAFMGERKKDVPAIAAAPNRYRFTESGRVVNIDVGTIHGAKGQTHTATLVLETFFKKHDLADLFPWLIGQGSETNRGPEREDRMRLIYTAMTRPTHLLCLAMRTEALGDGDQREANVGGLQSAGWTVTHV